MKCNTAKPYSKRLYLVLLYFFSILLVANGEAYEKLFQYDESRATELLKAKTGVYSFTEGLRITTRVINHLQSMKSVTDVSSQELFNFAKHIQQQIMQKANFIN